MNVDDEVLEVSDGIAEAVDDETITNDIEQIKNDFKETKGKCMKALDKVNMGVYCILASGKGSEWATKNGTEVTVKIKESTAETET